jgi:hypothetical protein
MQTLIQSRVLARVLALEHRPRPPLALRILSRWDLLQRIPGRIVGMGFRPEHVGR